MARAASASMISYETEATILNHEHVQNECHPCTHFPYTTICVRTSSFSENCWRSNTQRSIIHKRIVRAWFDAGTPPCTFDTPSLRISPLAFRAPDGPIVITQRCGSLPVLSIQWFSTGGPKRIPKYTHLHYTTIITRVASVIMIFFEAGATILIHEHMALSLLFCYRLAAARPTWKHRFCEAPSGGAT